MNGKETAIIAAWAANFIVVCGLNPGELGHCVGVLILYSATYFLFAPLHALIGLGVWTAYGLERASAASAADGAFLRAVSRLFCAESLVYWGIYWGMVLEIVPLHIRL